MIDVPVFAQFSSSGSLGSTTSGGAGVVKSRTTSVTDLQQVNDSKTLNLSGGVQGATGSNLNGAPGGNALQGIRVHILGDVGSPGVYPVNVSERAMDVMKYAGLNRPTTRVVQIRHTDEKTQYFDSYQYFYFGNLKHNPYLKDGDIIFIPKPSGAIRIEGPVSRPGVYELAGEKNLDQIVRLAGNFSNAQAKDYPIKVIRFAENGERQLLNVNSDTAALKGFKIKKGDIIVVPDVVNAGVNFDYSVETIPGENLVYPTSVPQVFVIGAVGSPGPIDYKSHLTIKDYVGFSGAGIDSNLRSVKVLRGNKKVKLNLYAKAQAGDVIIVRPRKLSAVLTYLGIVTTLMSFVTTTLLFKELVNNQ